MALRAEHEKAKSLKGMRVAGCLHVTKETAVLVKTLVAAGAEISWSGCNPLSTQDDVAAALAADGISVYAWHGQSRDEFYWCIDKTLEFKPTLTLDDGADLIFRVHSARTDLAPGVLGGTEETTTGVHRLRAMGAAGKLLYPVIAVNDAATKSDFDNVHGTGQSSIDGILRATSILLAGKTFVVAGYGHCGRGVAVRAKAMCSRVVVCEVDPLAALRAAMDGFAVMPMDEAAAVGDVFITATGVKDIIVQAPLPEDEGRGRGVQHRPLRLRDPHPRPRGARHEGDGGPGEQRGVPPARRPQDLPARQGQAREPRRRRRPPLRGHGHVLRQPVPVPRAPRPGGQDAWRRRSTRSARSRTARSPR